MEGSFVPGHERDNVVRYQREFFFPDLLALGF